MCSKVRTLCVVVRYVSTAMFYKFLYRTNRTCAFFKGINSILHICSRGSFLKAANRKSAKCLAVPARKFQYRKFFMKNPQIANQLCCSSLHLAFCTMKILDKRSRQPLVKPLEKKYCMLPPGFEIGTPSQEGSIRPLGHQSRY